MRTGSRGYYATRRDAVVVALAAVLAGAVAPAASPPNIVFILADDLGYGDLGCYGAAKVKTPNVDRLAAEGVRFTDAHSASSVCSPSRYALLAGEYPFRKNLWGPLPTSSPLAIPPEQKTLGAILQAQGYATACIGKWHLGFGAHPKPDWNAELKPGPLDVGFDYFFGMPTVSSYPPFVLIENRRVLGLDARDPIVYGGTSPSTPYPAKNLGGLSGGKAAHALYQDDQLGTLLAGKATEWIRANRERPFFLYFATPHIHHPFTPHPRFRGTSECGPYGDFIHEFDWMAGEILRTLDELQLSSNTLVILTSDNGGMLNQGGQDAWKAGHRMNGGLLGFKFDAWEGGHRVPFIARWPGQIKAGSTSDQLICHVDMPATLAALTGYRLQRGEAPDSVNVLAALTGTAAQPLRAHVVLAPHQKAHLALRQGPWVYIGAQGGGGFTGSKPGDHALGGPAALQFSGEKNSDVANGKFKRGAPAAQLYDLQADPFQTVNVIRQHPDIAAKMKKRLAQIVGTRPPRPNQKEGTEQ